MKKQKDGSYSIALIWNTDDVIYRAKEIEIKCTFEQAKDILSQIEHNHDCCNGVSWETIDVYLYDLKRG